MLSEFDNLEKYFSECQNRAFEEDMHTSLRVLSLRSKTKLFDCTVGDDCSSKFNNPDTFNDTKLLHEHFMINLWVFLFKKFFNYLFRNTVYNMTDFIQSNLKKDCLENSVLIIPTNLRCIHAEKYPDFWSLIGELDSTINNFIIQKKLSTNVLWINYNYLSPTDNGKHRQVLFQLSIFSWLWIGLFIEAGRVSVDHVYKRQRRYIFYGRYTSRAV